MIRTYLAPTVLVIVALTQRYLMHHQRLDPWKGGGFGMFSGISTASLRRMTVTLITESGEEKRFPPSEVARRIPLDGNMAWQRARLLTMPQTAPLQHLADVLAKAKWVAVQVPDQASATGEAALGPRIT